MRRGKAPAAGARRASNDPSNHCTRRFASCMFCPSRRRQTRCRGTNCWPGSTRCSRNTASAAGCTPVTPRSAKGRIVYEAPGLTALLAAHRALEEAVLSKQQNRFKPDVARKWVELVYEGFFHDQLKIELDAVLASSQAMGNGDVVLETRGGQCGRATCREGRCRYV